MAVTGHKPPRRYNRITGWGIQGMVRLAADSLVGGSLAEPARFHRSNLMTGLTPFNARVRNRLIPLVLSAPAVVYGQLPTLPLAEARPFCPAKPHGKPKWPLGRVIAGYRGACGLQSVALRRFNAARGDMALARRALGWQPAQGLDAIVGRPRAGEQPLVARASGTPESGCS